MAYDRYDSRRASGGPPRYPNEPYSDREGRGRGDRDERGFFERAGEQIASWFGDEDDDDRNYSADRPGFRGRDRERHGRDQGGWRASPQPQGWGSRVPADREYERGDRDFDERPERGSYRPLAGDYGRSEGSAGGYGRSGSSQWPGGGSDRYEGPWSRDEYRRSSFAGSAERGPERGQSYDPHYQQWRQRQIEELDRDYDEYRREHQSKFENDFGSWRSNRQTKRQLLGQVREHMEVVGSDDQPVGTVDKVARDRIILTKSGEADGVHHSLSCTDIDRIEGDRVILGSAADEARSRWREEGRDRAMFEREGGSERDSGEGPHILDRSFSGTYR